MECTFEWKNQGVTLKKVSPQAHSVSICTAYALENFVDSNLPQAEFKLGSLGL